MLRQGEPVADICYLLPEGAPHVFRPPGSALEGILGDRRGYNFDGCTPEALIAEAAVRDGRVVFPGGAAYRLLVLPILLAAGAIVARVARMIRRPRSSGKPGGAADRLVLLLGLWWVFDMAFVWISPRSYAQSGR